MCHFNFSSTNDYSWTSCTRLWWRNVPRCRTWPRRSSSSTPTTRTKRWTMTARGSTRCARPSSRPQKVHHPSLTHSSSSKHIIESCFGVCEKSGRQSWPRWRPASTTLATSCHQRSSTSSWRRSKYAFCSLSVFIVWNVCIACNDLFVNALMTGVEGRSQSGPLGLQGVQVERGEHRLQDAQEARLEWGTRSRPLGLGNYRSRQQVSSIYFADNVIWKYRSLIN